MSVALQHMIVIEINEKIFTLCPTCGVHNIRGRTLGPTCGVQIATICVQTFVVYM